VRVAGLGQAVDGTAEGQVAHAPAELGEGVDGVAGAGPGLGVALADQGGDHLLEQGRLALGEQLVHAQVACFQNAAAQVRGGGRFVIEVGVPQLQRLPPGETVRAFALTPTHLGFDEYDTVNQGLISHHYRVEDGRLEASSLPLRYVWPSELDLMARLAGLLQASAQHTVNLLAAPLRQVATMTAALRDQRAEGNPEE